MNPRRPTFAVFDFDRTVTRHGTFTPFLLGAALQKPWRCLCLPVAGLLALAYVLRLISRKRLKEHMLRFFLAGTSRSDIDELASRFVARLLSSGVHAKALEAIAMHRKQGHTLVLATASMDFYVSHVARALRFDFEISTRSVFGSDQTLRPEILGDNCYGQAKAERLAELIKRERPQDVWFYSDHVTDVPSFLQASKKIAVNPSRALAIHAQHEGWTTVQWD